VKAFSRLVGPSIGQFLLNGHSDHLEADRLPLVSQHRTLLAWCISVDYIESRWFRGLSTLYVEVILGNPPDPTLSSSTLVLNAVWNCPVVAFPFFAADHFLRRLRAHCLTEIFSQPEFWPSIRPARAAYQASECLTAAMQKIVLSATLKLVLPPLGNHGKSSHIENTIRIVVTSQSRTWMSQAYNRCEHHLPKLEFYNT